MDGDTRTSPGIPFRLMENDMLTAVMQRRVDYDFLYVCYANKE